MQSKSGTFTGNNATGNQAITGVGFTPEFLLIIGVNTADNVATTDARLCVGFASSAANQQAMDFRDDDAQTTTNTARSQQSGKIVSIVSLAADTLSISGDLVSFDGDGFTINWTNATSAVFHYIAIAGSDFQVKVGSFDMNGSTGNQAVTGIGFQPKAVMFFGTIDNTTEGAQAQAKLTMGCATASNQRWATSQYDQDTLGASNSIAQEYFTESSCIVRINETVVTLAADFVSMDSDGFTVNITTALACRMPYIAFGGTGNFKAGTVVQRTSNGTEAETGVGFQPNCVLFAGSGSPTLDAVSDDCYPVIGWSDSALNEAVATCSVNDNVGTSDSHRDQGSGACIQRMSATSNTVLTAANMNSLDADGFTLNWSATTATACIIGYLAIGSFVAPVVPGVAIHRAFPIASSERLFPSVNSRTEPVV